MKTKHAMWAFFALISLVFLVLQATHLRPAVSDENIYIYMAKEVTEGKLPYKDFFLAHPPLHVLMMAAIYKVFGFNLIVLKATAPLLMTAAAALMFKTVMERIGNTEALTAATLLYFSYDTMRFSTHATWISLATALTAASAYFLLHDRKITAGITMGLAGLSGLLSVIAAAAIIAYLAATDRKAMIKFSTAFLAVFILANIALTLIFSSYTDDTIKYHLTKPREESNKASIIWTFIKQNPLIWAGAALFFLAQSKTRHALLIPLAITVSYITTLLMLNKIFAYYFLIMLPFLAIISAYGITSLAKRINHPAAWAVITLAMLILCISAASKYYSNTFQDFEDADKIAQYIEQNSAPDDTIFGDDSITPLLALKSSRQLTGNIIDSNNLRWRSGQLNINETISQIKSARYIVERRLNEGKGSYIYGPSYLDEFKAFLRTCKPEQAFKTEWNTYLKEYYLYDCRS